MCPNQLWSLENAFKLYIEVIIGIIIVIKTQLNYIDLNNKRAYRFDGWSGYDSLDFNDFANWL